MKRYVEKINELTASIEAETDELKDAKKRKVLPGEDKKPIELVAPTELGGENEVKERAVLPGEDEKPIELIAPTRMGGKNRLKGADEEIEINIDDEDDEMGESAIFINKLVDEEIIEEGDKEEYQKFFKGKLKEFGVKSPAELDDAKKKEFFSAIEKGWTKDKDA